MKLPKIALLWQCAQYHRVECLRTLHQRNTKVLTCSDFFIFSSFYHCLLTSIKQHQVATVKVAQLTLEIAFCMFFFSWINIKVLPEYNNHGWGWDHCWSKDSQSFKKYNRRQQIRAVGQRTFPTDSLSVPWNAHARAFAVVLQSNQHPAVISTRHCN